MTKEERIQKALERNEEYWEERLAREQTKISNKNIKQIEKQLKKYFGSSMKRVIADFEATYDKIMAAKAEGKEVTPADLYKLDRYWTMQAQLRNELQKLGDKQIAAASKIFEIHFFDIYYSIAIPSLEAFTNIDKAAAMQLINAIWCADGQDYKQRIWKNVEQLVETLNEGLVDSVITGRKTTQLKKLLVERFKVSYHRADALVQTEIAHIQNTAARQRYMDYGIQKYRVRAAEDERRCEICGRLHGTVHEIGEREPVPAHPRCRCSIIPIRNK